MTTPPDTVTASTTVRCPRCSALHTSRVWLRGGIVRNAIKIDDSEVFDPICKWCGLDLTARLTGEATVALHGALVDSLC